MIAIGTLGVLASSCVCLAGSAALFATGTERSPLAGAATVSATLACAEPRAEADRAILARRLDSLSIEHELTVVDPTHLRVVLREVSGPRALSSLIARGELEMTEVVEGATDVDPRSLGTGVRLEHPREGATAYHATSPEQLAALASHTPAGARFTISCAESPGEERDCEAFFLRVPAPIGTRDVATAEAQIDEHSGTPQVAITFTPEGGRRFEELTASLVDRRLAIVLDGRVMSAPVVMERIGGGRAVISLGVGGFEELLAEAYGIAAALRSGEPLGCAWEIQSMP